MRYGLNQSILWQTVAALLFFLPLPVWAQGALEGTVRAADTDATLADVQVVLPDIYLGDSTEPDGFYRIERIPVGSHLVEVRLLGYRTEFAEVLITGRSYGPARYRIWSSLPSSWMKSPWSAAARRQRTVNRVDGSHRHHRQ